MGGAHSCSAPPPGEATPLKGQAEQGGLLSGIVEYWRSFQPDAILRRKKLYVKSNAEANSNVRRCVKVRYDPDGNYRSGDGDSYFVENFSITKQAKDLHEYGCSVAIQLFLSFNLDTCLLFLCMFVVAIYPTVEMVHRSNLRGACRNELINGDYAQITSSASTSDCGYAGLNVAPNPPVYSGWLYSPTIGACMEYRNVSSVETQPRYPDAYIETPDASFCLGHNDVTANVMSMLCGVLNVMLLIAFVEMINKRIKATVKKFDTDVWSAADYAVQISGLQVDTEVYSYDHARKQPGLQKRLLADLKTLGFEESKIDHIAFGVYCAEDMKLMKEVASYVIQIKEIEAKEEVRKLQGDEPPLTESMAKRKADLTALLKEARLKLVEMHKRPHKSTGHAFIVFKYERDRNLMLKKFHYSDSQRSSLALFSTLDSWFGSDLVSFFCSDAPPKLECADNLIGMKGHKKHVIVEPAPEPSEIHWENLGLDTTYEFRAQLLTYTITTLAVGLLLLASAYIQAHKVGTFMFIGFELPVGSTVVAVSNAGLKSLITFMSEREGLDTKTETERSLFTKLSLSLVFNTVIIPMAVAIVVSTTTLGKFGIDQSWYEVGGVINGFLTLCVMNVAIDGLLQVVPIAVLLKRYVLTRFYVSEYKVAELWLPPEFPVAYLHAVSLKTIALCLLYAPLYPPAYLFSAGAMLFIFAFSKFSIAYWYRRPPTISERMLGQLRAAMLASAGLHVGVMYFAAYSSPAPDDRYIPVIGCIFCTIALCITAADLLVPWRVCVPWLKEEEKVFESEDTAGIEYKDVPRIKKVRIERYSCPAFTEQRQTNDVDNFCLRHTDARMYTEQWNKVKETDHWKIFKGSDDLNARLNAA